MALAKPNQITVPFSSNGVKNTIPETATGSNLASMQEGFPVITMTDVDQGGIPPQGQDMNGILFDVTKAIQYQQAGGLFPYDATFAQAIDGYPLGALLTSTDGMKLYRNLLAGNQSDPENGGQNWLDISDMDVAEVTATGSTTPRTLANRFADVINVKDFGAKGDGTTDDTTAIQAAFNAGIGKKVIFPTARYVCGRVDIPDGVGCVDFLNSTILKQGYSTHGIVFSGCKNLLLQNVRVVNGTNNSRASFLRGLDVENLTVSNVFIFTDTAYDGAVGTNGLVLSGNNIIVDNIEIDFDASGRWCDGIHLGVVNNVSISNFNIKTSDDCIAVCPDTAITGSFVNAPLSNVVIGNGTAVSRDANSFKLGFVVRNNETYDQLTLSDIIIHDVVCGDTQNILNTDLTGASTPADGGRFQLRNVIATDSSVASNVGAIRLAYPFSTVEMSGLDINRTSASTQPVIYTSLAGSVHINDAQFTDDVSSGSVIQFVSIPKVELENVAVKSTSSGSLITASAPDFVKVDGCTIESSSNAFAAINLSSLSASSKMYFLNNVISGVARGIHTSGTVDTYVVFGNLFKTSFRDFSEITATTNVVKNTPDIVTTSTGITATGSTTARTLADWMKDVSESVRFTSQELTDAQKAKARENIDVFNINAEYEKLDDFIFAFGYYRAWANADTDNAIKRNYSECLVSSDGVSFHNAGNFDTTFKDGLNECRWGYIPEFYDSKLYLSSTYGLKAWYYITDDLKTFSVYEYPITIENTGVEIEGADAAPMVTLKNVSGTWYSIIQIPTNTPVIVPDGGGSIRAKRVHYIATGNPDTNTWGEPELFTELNSLSTSLFDVTFYEDNGTYYILGQEMTTRKLKLFKSTSFLSGYSLVKEFDVSYFLETPTVVKYKGRYFIYAMAYETGTLVCFVSGDMETWSQASGISSDRILNFDKRGGNLRFIKCLVADTDEKRQLIFNYMRYSGSTVNLANDFVYKHDFRYGTHIKIDPNIVNGSKVNTTFSNFVLVPGSIYTLEDNVQITITGFDTSLMGRGDKCWFLVKHNSKNSRIIISSSARSDSFSWGKNEFLGYDSLSFGVVTNTNNELIEISAEFVDYKIICYLDVDLNKQILATSTASVDLNNIQFTSFWTFTGSQATNGSNFPTTEGGLLVVKAHGGTIYQEYIRRNPDINVYRRMFNPGVGWYGWVQNTL